MCSPYRKGGERGMEEENILGFHAAELSAPAMSTNVDCPVNWKAHTVKLKCSEGKKSSNGCGQRHSHD